MNQNEFIRHFAGKYNVSITATKNWVDGIFEEMCKVMEDPEVDKLVVNGFGSFVKSLRPPKHILLPDGTPCDAPERIKVKYIPSRNFEKAIASQKPVGKK